MHEYTLKDDINNFLSNISESQIITLYPKAAIHGHEWIVEFTPFTILLSSFFTELNPHWDGNSTIEILSDVDVFSSLLLAVVVDIDSVTGTLVEIVVDLSDFTFGASVAN